MKTKIITFEYTYTTNVKVIFDGAFELPLPNKTLTEVTKIITDILSEYNFDNVVAIDADTGELLIQTFYDTP